MLRSFAHTPNGSCEQLATLDEAIKARSEAGALLWLDLDNPDDAELDGIREAFDLDEDAINDCREGTQRPRIDEYKGYIFVVCYEVFAEDTASDLIASKLTIFLGDGFLITTHRDPMRAIETVLDRCERRGANLLGRGVGFLLYSILDTVVDDYLLVTEAYETVLDHIEDDALDPEADASFLHQLQELRRGMLKLRRMAASQKELLGSLTSGVYELVGDDLDPRFRHVRDHLIKVIEIIDGQRELLGAARENYNSALSNRLNATMKTLTIFATVLLPPSLLAGIYGMNLKVWPSPEAPWSSLMVFGTMLASSLGMLAFFYRKKWL